MRFAGGGRALEALAGGSGGGAQRAPRRWRTQRTGADPWTESGTAEIGDLRRLRGRRASLVRAALQEGLLFPTARVVARPRVTGADDLLHAPQPAVIAANHSSDIDTPLILGALPRPWRSRTVVGAASDRFYRSPRVAFTTALWINTFPFDRGAELRGLADAAQHLREGRNVLLYPQGTRTAAFDGFRAGVARLCAATGTPVVPVHLTGTALIMPKGRGLIQRGDTTVAFGRPLHPRPGEQLPELAERIRAAIAELDPRLRGRRRSG